MSQPVRVSDQAPHPTHAADHVTSDTRLIRMWVHGKSPNTQEAYLRDVGQFLTHARLPLRSVTLRELQGWSDELRSRGLSPATRRRKIATIKSLFSFGHKLGYFPFNVGAVVTGPKVRDDLAERILTSDAVKRIIDMGDTLRNTVLLRLFYASGGRVSELASLKWRSVIRRDGRNVTATGQLSLHGKGEKTRHVLLTRRTWEALTDLRRHERSEGYGGDGDPVFRSRKGGPLTRHQLWRIVKRAARRAGCPEAVSPHWLRHAHASHALDEGAPVHLVQRTLGHESLATTSRYTHARPNDSSSNYLDV